jgi:hypothetical protein
MGASPAERHLRIGSPDDSGISSFKDAGDLIEVEVIADGVTATTCPASRILDTLGPE